jgi:hypothetical protein
MWIILLVLIAASLAVAFLPQLKGFRTQAFAVMSAIWTAVLPLLGDIFSYLKDLDWRQYVSPEQAPWLILAVTLVFMGLRYVTTGPVGRKE